MDSLSAQAITNKIARIQLKQVVYSIMLLSISGTRVGEKVTKHLDGEIWELRPGNNRVLYFFSKMKLLFFFTILEKNTKDS